jgi:hypothetical protein
MRTNASDLFEAKALADWLNHRGNAETVRAQRRVREAIRLLREMDSMRASQTVKSTPAVVMKGHRVVGLQPGQSGKSLSVPREHLTAYNQARIRSERLAPARRPYRVLPGGPGGRHGYFTDSQTPLQHGFELLGGVSRRGLLELLLQCRRKNCGKWFVLKKRNKAFCSAECQYEYWSEYRRTPKGREEEKLRMRRLRELRGRGTKS